MTYNHLPSRSTPETHQRGERKVARLAVKVKTNTIPLRKPSWIRSAIPSGGAVGRIKRLLRKGGLSSVCEEAACPNLGDCFSHGTAAFMIMGDLCTRRCPFCDVAHGHPLPLDCEEPRQLAEAVRAMGLRYVVVTSVDRDDLPDGGGGHYASVIRALRRLSPDIQVEVLTPDFRGRMDRALQPFREDPPDIFNHNLETVARLYRKIRPGGDYAGSLRLLQRFGAAHPEIPTKSGLMLGLGETLDEVVSVMRDLRNHGCRMLTLGQYLQPGHDHLPVERYVTPEEFDRLRREGEAMGFSSITSGPMVRSSYHADQQAKSL